MQKYENPAQSVIFFEGSQTGTNWVQRYFVHVKKSKTTPCNMKYEPCKYEYLIYVVFFFRKSDIAALLYCQICLFFLSSMCLCMSIAHASKKGSEMKKGKVDLGESAQKKHKTEAEVKHCKT